MKKMEHKDCEMSILPIRDALDAINGKWRILIVISLMKGNKRFKEIERSIPKINGKVLAKELRDLEINGLIKRTVYDDVPVLIEYTVTPYAATLEPIIDALQEWGKNHRKVIIGK